MKPQPDASGAGPARDVRGRPLSDLRVSVTDRCNFRCPYCMPRDAFGPGHAFLPPERLLSVGETARLVAVFTRLGVTKVRLTGGEPLLRPDLEDLVSAVAALPGVRDLALTTNGSLLASRAASLRQAGLGRVTVSLDSLDPGVFAAMGDTRTRLDDVLDGLVAAAAAGLAPVKINAVLRRGVNEEGLLDLAGFAREHGHLLRVIEYMDVGTTNGWQLTDVVPAAEVLARIAAVWPLEPVLTGRRGEVAERYRYLDGAGELGVIASVTRPFCADCSRARLAADGELFTCLFASTGTDLRAPLRAGADDAALEALLRGIWSRRVDRFSELRAGEGGGGTHAEMSYLGG